MYNKKASIEEIYNNEYRKIHIEQGTNTTDVDYVNELKQELAKDGLSFINGFISAIPIVLLICLGILVAMFFYIF